MRLTNPPATIAHTQVPEQTCKICGYAATLFDVVDFNKFCNNDDYYGLGLAGTPVYYYQCHQCYFVFTTFFDQLSREQMGEYIYNEEYLLVDGAYLVERPGQMAELFGNLLSAVNRPGFRVLDYGAGSGAMANALSQRGIETACFDPFSHPSRPHGLFDVVTCTEVMEHACDPMALVADLLSFLAEGGAILFTTAVLPPDIQRIRAAWWYIAPRNGHVSIFSEKALMTLGRNLGLAYHPGDGLHGFVREGEGALLARIAPDMRHPLRQVTLCASNEANHPQWYPPEQGRFRWARSAFLSWPLACTTDSVLQVEIPFEMEIRPNFAAECRVRVGDNEVSVRIERNTIRAMLLVSGSASRIELILPPLVKPVDLHTSTDTRPLGLAIRLTDA